MTYDPPRSEPEELAELIDINVDFATKMACPAIRSEHGKGIADLRASFTVLDHLPTNLRQGLFAKPAQFDATVRFSNSAAENDAKRDTHGMAIKVTNVPMETAPKDAKDQRFQDFILLDCPTFVMGDLRDYIPFNRAFLDAKISVSGKLHLAWLLLTHPKRIRPLLRMALNKANGPLSTGYWSTTPYNLGKQVVKYKVQPIDPERPHPKIRGVDGRRDALRRHLAKTSGRFAFGVLVQTDPARQPIDAPEQDWEDNGAQFHALAEITVLAGQPVEAPKDIENRLTFSPGHASVEHAPLGAINRARVAIYSAASRTRKAAFEKEHMS